MVAVPSPMGVRRKPAILSPGSENASDAVEGPVTLTGPSTEMLTSALSTSLSMAKTFTAMSTSSPVARTRGREDSIMSGLRTATLFSAFPYAASCPATSITLTLPTYIGRVTLCVAVPLSRVKGPRNLTTGLKRLSFFCIILMFSSPPMACSGENLPLHAPITALKRSQVLTPRASRAYM